jgi:hypothetical protein
VPFKRPLARREIIGLSVIAACIAGAVIVGLLLLTGDDNDPATGTTQIERPITDSTPPVKEDKSRNGGEGKPAARSETGAPRRPVPAPKFSAGVVTKGTLPQPINGKLQQALDDGNLTQDELRGTPTVLTAFSSKCDFCGPEARLLQAEWKRWAPRGVAYLGLSVRESPDSARVFTDKNDIGFPVVSDRSGQTAADFDIVGIPETVFISAPGRIVGRVIGGATIGQLEAGSSAARFNRPFGVQQGGARVPIR